MKLCEDKGINLYVRTRGDTMCVTPKDPSAQASLFFVPLRFASRAFSMPIE